ncbi:MAG: M17 family metallopeptidase [Actinomycetota bacterium]|nr:M17 family metallopeptidase [Actinomycetota bacterium]MDQ2894425.1 M17 family metallopeptidase [Actinomycetota bacterium]
MPDYLMSDIRSRVADVKNFPYEPTARASTAAMFLREFVPVGTSWAHLDIEGPAWADNPYEVNAAGATGYGLRLLLELFGLVRDAELGYSPV